MEIISVTSSDTTLVNIIPNPLFQGVSFQCIQDKKGTAVISVRWRNRAGREESRSFVVACGVQLKNVVIDLDKHRIVFKDHDLKLSLRDKITKIQVVSGKVSGTVAGGEFLDGLFVEEGTNIALLTVIDDGREENWLVTINVVPKKISQNALPENRTQQVVLAPGDCPPGMAFNANLSRLATAADFGGAQAGGLVSVGTRSIREAVCRTPQAVGWWNFISSAARVNVEPVTHEAARRALAAVGVLRGRTQNARLFYVGEDLGDEEYGMTANFTQSSGQRNDLVFLLARDGNVLWWLMAQGTVGSVRPEMLIPYGRRMKANVAAAARP